jgi:uncharacterized protein
MARVLRHPLVRALLGCICLVLPVIAVQTLLRITLQLAPQSSVAVAAGLVVMTMAYVAFVRLFERRQVTELAMAPAPRELAVGAAIGATLFTITIGVLAALGVCSVVGGSSWAVIGPIAIGAIGSGCSEELLVRGMFFRPLEEWLGTWMATAVSALLFGLLHLANPHSGIVPALAIALEAGVLLAGAFVLTRRLWLPIGIHIAWNFTQAGVFGVPVSGQEISGILRAKLQGPEILSGGAFGAETSVVAVVVCTGAAAAIFWLAVRRGRVVAPSWRSSRSSAGASV